MPDLIESAASPAAAWRNGSEASGRGDHAAGVAWLERAVRLAPADPRIALDLANVRLALGGAAQCALAGEAFALLASRYDVIAAWLGLLTVRLLSGDHAGAASILRDVLRRHCVPEDPAFAQVASMVANGAGYDGWSGMLPDGTVRRVGDGALGPPFDEAALRRVEGVVSVVDGGLVGWAARPAAPGLPPDLLFTDAAGHTAPVTFGQVLPPDDTAPLARRHSFLISARRLAGLSPPFRILSPHGADLFGSPADPLATEDVTPVPAAARGNPVSRLPPRAPLAVVMPVYRDATVTRAALESLFAAAPPAVKIIVVDDASPEPNLSDWLTGLAAAGQIVLHRHAANTGFAAAANTGLAAAAGHDVLLLNSDTLIPPGAIEALAAAVYAAPDIGTATPFSNDATILNVPNPTGGNKMPDLAGATSLQRLAAAANEGAIIDIPTAIGFCMLIRHDCLAATGAFRTEIFAQGYGEENDFSLRARQRGYRHVAAAGAYVAHRGGVSFRAAGRALNARNAAILNRLYPGYDDMIAGFIAADPLAPARFRLDAARFAAGRNRQGAVLLISHNHGGGVARVVAEGMRAIHDSGLRPLLLTPATARDPASTPFPWDTELSDGEPGDYPNLTFKLPTQLPDLLTLLHGEKIQHAVMHHALGHHPAIRSIAHAIGVPQDIVIHDYTSFCPRVTLLTAPDKSAPLRYCGEPNVAGCTACFQALGDETFENLPPAALAARSAGEFAAARGVIAPSADTARRLTRHFPKLRPKITPWEDDSEPRALTPPPATGPRRIVVVGGIGPSKGYDILLECARDASRRRLNLEFFIAGTSADDEPLLETGHIFITGAYREGEATQLIQSLRPDLAFLPSIWPETWCFALGEAWRAGLYTIAFDLGAQAARIKATNRGAVLPLGLPVARINDALLGWRPA
jgi:GT2 family glycosyltransferase/glycosyltransferase involved in cell wall biosynthesis